jgi:predicted phage terminase large subunit-like protein
MPPRHGKSELASHYFPAWYLGTFPDRKVILTSYGADFASTWGAKVRDTLLRVGKELFGIQVAGQRSDSWTIAGHEGGMFTTGVGGPITGRGAHLLIMDDPVKNEEEAKSETYREKTDAWWLSTASTRLTSDGAVVLIMTRWHEDDLAGRIIHRMKTDPASEQWRIVSLPAIAERPEEDGAWKRAAGEALCPMMFPVERLNQIRHRLGSYWWSSLFQQNPVPDGGGVLMRSWFRYWRWSNDPERIVLEDVGVVNPWDGRRFCTVDLAVSEKDSADWTVVQTFTMVNVRGKRHLILLDQQRQRLEGPDIVPFIERAATAWKVSFVGIESVQFQRSIVQEAARRGLPVRELESDRDKVSRAYGAAPMMERGEVWFPMSSSWLPEFEREIVSFPVAKHDDQVDALVYGILTAATVGRGLGPNEDAGIEREDEGMHRSVWDKIRPRGKGLLGPGGRP